MQRTARVTAGGSQSRIVLQAKRAGRQPNQRRRAADSGAAAQTCHARMRHARQPGGSAAQRQRAHCSEVLHPRRRQQPCRVCEQASRGRRTERQHRAVRRTAAAFTAATRPPLPLRSRRPVLRLLPRSAAMLSCRALARGGLALRVRVARAARAVPPPQWPRPAAQAAARRLHAAPPPPQKATAPAAAQRLRPRAAADGGAAAEPAPTTPAAADEPPAVTFASLGVRRRCKGAASGAQPYSAPSHPSERTARASRWLRSWWRTWRRSVCPRRRPSRRALRPARRCGWPKPLQKRMLRPLLR